MATDAASIGESFSDYQGNAGLAGGNFGVVAIDVKPLENLAAYTLMYNKNVWAQQQKDTDDKIARLADLSNIALNNLRAKDKEQATKEFAELQKYAAEYARKTPKTPQEKMQNELEWQSKYGAFKNNYNSGKDRAVTYQKRLNDIQGDATKDARAKDAEIAILNKEFDNTDIGTKISGVAEFKTAAIDVPTPTAQKFNSVSILANDNAEVTGSIYNPKVNAGQADAVILGVKKLYPQEGTAEYNALSEAEKNQVKVQSTVESGSKVWVDATVPLNETIKNYVKDGVFDAVAFENENASNTTLMNAYNALKRYDSYNKEKFSQASQGMFMDKGLPIKLPDNVVADDFRVGFVDFAKGVTPNQLVQSGMYAKYAGDVFDKKLTYTGAENKKKDLSLEWYKARTGRISATRPSGEGGGKQEPLLQQPALIFGEHVNRLKKALDKQGGADFKINYEGTDEITRNALGLQKGKYVVYKADGTAFVNADKNGVGGQPLTIEEQKNNFILAVKGGSKDEAMLDAKFLGNAETGFQAIFGGITSGTQIWNGWGGTKPSTTGATGANPTSDDSKLSDAQYFIKYKKSRK